MVSLSTVENNCVLAFPDEKPGMVKVIHFNKDKEIKVFKAHSTMIAGLKLSQDGTLLATASQKGTLIRLYNPYTEEMLTELRRGAV